MASDPRSPHDDRTSIAAESTAPTESAAAPAAPDDEPRRTLLRTAATGRPLAEVASLVSLLRQTGESPSPGDEAVRLAAVSRPVDDVRQLVSLLGEPPHVNGEAGTALRAAAMGRPIEDVAELVTLLGPEATDPAATGPDPTPTPGLPEAARPPGPAQPNRSGGAEKTWAVRGAARGLLTGTPGARTTQSSLRSVLRWPAAVALLVVAAIHVPTDIAGLRAGDVAAGVSLVIAALCLVLAVLLAVQDTVWIWAASATAAVGTMALHSVAAGLGPVHLLRDSLGRSFAGSTTTVLACAALAAALAGSALLRRQKSPVTVSDA